MSRPYPSLYQINTRVVLGELSGSVRKPATFDDVTDTYLDRLAELGFDWVWWLGVWQTGPAGRAVSLRQPEWRREYSMTLSDLTDDDITGSPYAIRQYTVHSDFGGDPALSRLRQRMRQRGLHLLLDFVPNHVALDHPWAHAHPEYFVHGDEILLSHEPQNYVRVNTNVGPRVLAHGRDPYFPGWPDTLQINYRSGSLRAAMLRELLAIAQKCDGVRCDMAMLLLPEVIHRTWGDRSLPVDGSPPVEDSFWLSATRTVHQQWPEFRFLAEVYWDLEWELQQQGFDYTYDKRLYDRLHHGDAPTVRGHLLADFEFQEKSARFLENHDEPRASVVFPEAMHKAAAVLTFLTPGMRFFHEGQLEGRRYRVSMHLGRRPEEPLNSELLAFYEQLLTLLQRPVLRGGLWRLLECHPAWGGNATWMGFLVMTWENVDERLLIAVNFGASRGQCFVPLLWLGLASRSVRLVDQLGPATYDRDGNELIDRGLFLDLESRQFHVFQVQS